MEYFDVETHEDLQATIDSTTGSISTITLLSGGNIDYKSINIKNKHNLILQAVEYGGISINLLVFGGSSNITIQNLNLSSSRQIKAGDKDAPNIIEARNGTKNITVKACYISSYSYDLTKEYVQNLRDFPENNVLQISQQDLQTYEWPNGILMRADNGIVINNVLTNIRKGIQAGTNSKCSLCKKNLIENNFIQFFSEDGIRAIGHNVDIVNNHIYDPVIFDKDKRKNNAHQDAIQFFRPSKNLYCGGKIENINILKNTISVKKGNIPSGYGTCLQGIFASDGYLKNIIIKENIVKTNSAHGVSLNGSFGVEIIDNEIELLEMTEGCPKGPTSSDNGFSKHPGIKLNYTRTCENGKWTWKDTKYKYSVILKKNKAPILTLPTLLTPEQKKQFQVTLGKGNDANTFWDIGITPTLHKKCSASC